MATKITRATRKVRSCCSILWPLRGTLRMDSFMSQILITIRLKQSILLPRFVQLYLETEKLGILTEMAILAFRYCILSDKLFEFLIYVTLYLFLQFNEPGGLCIDTTLNNLYVADTNNHCIRKICLGSKNAITVRSRFL